MVPGLDAQLRQGGDTKDGEHHDHPGRGDVGKPGHCLIATGCNIGEKQAGQDHRPGQPRPWRQPVVQRGHGEAHGPGHGRCRDVNHSRSDAAPEQAVSEVVDFHQPGPADLLELKIQGQTMLDRNRRGDQRPSQDGQQVAHEQAGQQIEGGHAMNDKERADQQLGASDMFAGEHPNIAAQSFGALGGDRLAFELVGGPVGRLRCGVCWRMDWILGWRRGHFHCWTRLRTSLCWVGSAGIQSMSPVGSARRMNSSSSSSCKSTTTLLPAAWIFLMRGNHWRMGAFRP